MCSLQWLAEPGMKRQGERILRMEDAGTSEEDDIDSQDSNTPIDHGHLAQNCLIKKCITATSAFNINSCDPININSFYGPSKSCINRALWHLCHKNYDVINQVTGFITEFYCLLATKVSTLETTFHDIISLHSKQIY